jgi:osmotically inducible protein OsmC
MDNSSGGWTFEKITLHLTADVPGISSEQFQELAAAAKGNCPVSKALAAVPIELVAHLA